MEHLRRDFPSHTIQWCDADLVQIVDTHTGEVERIFLKNASAYGTYKEAIDVLSCYDGGMLSRYAIIKINAIVPHTINKEK